MTTAREHARALLAELDGATWAEYPEDRERIVTGHFERAIAGREIAKATAPRNKEYDAERREITARVATPQDPGGVEE